MDFHWLDTSNCVLTLNTVGFYAGLNLIAWFMIFCFVRETKQLTLEELDRKYKPRSISRSTDNFEEVFSVPTSKFISHEATVWLPYFIKRHIFRRKIEKPPQIIEKADKVDAILGDA